MCRRQGGRHLTWTHRQLWAGYGVTAAQRLCWESPFIYIYIDQQTTSIWSMRWPELQLEGVRQHHQRSSSICSRRCWFFWPSWGTTFTSCPLKFKTTWLKNAASEGWWCWRIIVGQQRPSNQTVIFIHHWPNKHLFLLHWQTVSCWLSSDTMWH